MHGFALLVSLALAPSAASAPASRPATDARDDAHVDDDDAPASMPARARDVRDDEAPSSMPASMPASAPSSMPATTTARGDEADAPRAVDVAPRAELAPMAADPRALSAGRVTSRPGATESARLLLRGAGLLSLGLAAHAALGPRMLVEAEKLVAPDLTLRYAIFDGVEVRVSAVGEIAPEASRPLASWTTAASLGLGTSIRVLESSAWYLPDAAVLIVIDVPVETLAVDDMGASARAMATWTLFERMALSGNVGAAYDGRTQAFTFPFTAQVAVDVAGGFGAFGETFGSVALSGLPDVWVDGGVYYDVGSLVRLDASAGLNPFSRGDLSSTGGWFVGVGASVLLPGHLPMFML